jgi:poly-gamma-glutamate synthesis protein (capsule biosynthesis protein)
MTSGSGKDRSGAIELAFTGDVCLGAGVRDPGQPPLEEALRRVAPAFEHCAAVIGNFECVLVAPQAPEDVKCRKMAVPVAAGSGLREAGFTAFTLANNHVMDGGLEGLECTRDELTRQGIGHFGAGRSLAEATRPLLLHVAGRKIALLGACDYSRHFAASRRPGIAPLDAVRLIADVGALSSQCDVVIAVLHADLEFARYPAPWRVALSRRLVDAGAHLVIQHHPHVVQGIEHYRKALIAYSLGNLVFRISGNPYQERHPHTRLGLILRVGIDFPPQGGATLSAVPVPVEIGHDHFPRLLAGAARERALVHLAALSKRLRDEAFLRHAWQERCRGEVKAAAWNAYYALRAGKLRAVIGTVSAMLRDPAERRTLRGWLTGGPAA